jgi:5-methylcytosine-specific restriction endonuclease McrA
VKGKAKAVGVTAKQLRALLERQQYKCAITGWELTPKTASPDHVIPISRGGTHSIENLQIVHARVNVCKGALLMEEFIDVCRAVVDKCSTGPSPT